VNLKLIDTVKWRGLKHGVFRPIAIGIIYIKLRVAVAGTAGIVPVRVVSNTIVLVGRRKVTVAEFIITIAGRITHIVPWGNEVRIHISTVCVPGKLYSNRNDKDISVHSDNVASAAIVCVSGGHRYSVPALMEFNRGFEAIIIAA
jgi:hypothetical protein